MSKQHTEISKFLSYVLRHEPQAIGLRLDSDGWAELDALISCALSAGRSLDVELIRSVVGSNDKQRFALSQDGQRIRAVQGHSTDAVTIKREPKQPPEYLFHGTATRFLDSILAQGLRPGSRHEVHLSTDVSTAISVGQRHGKAVVLRVDALRMHQQGFAFFQAENGVWLSERVPSAFLELHFD